jgi:hypothetical protein
MKAALSGLLVAGAIMTTSSAAVAAPISGSVIKQAADEIAVGETVHCRRYRHWHRWGYGRGCGGGVVLYGPRVRSGYSVRIHQYYDARPSVSRYRYGDARLHYRDARPQSKWEQKGFCPPGQRKKGNC